MNFRELLNESKPVLDVNHLIDLIWEFFDGEGFDKKSDIYRDYKKEMDSVCSGKLSLDEALDLLGFSKVDDKDPSVKVIIDYIKTELK